ncbi:tetratricopeptide repeat protein [Paracoccus sp. ME4]|uniref:tetratricopeptide repeat protein n=1 Tax=Paracoccus sp. ME4 TaxID=3138066 RepID=UPI00398A8C1F
MAAKKYLIGALAVLPIVLQTAFAQSLPDSAAGADAPLEVMGPIAPEAISSPDRTLAAPRPSWSDTADVAEADFPDLYRAGMSDVPSSKDIDGWLEHARVLLAGGLFRESAGALERIVALTDGEGLSGTQRARIVDLSGALRLMGAEPDIGPIPQAGAAGSGGYFAALGALRSMADPSGAEVLAVGSGLARQSAPVIRRSIPLLIEAVRRSGDMDAARALHAITKQTSGVAGTALGHFLDAEILRMEGHSEDAFVEYGKAAAQRGEYAIRARLGIAELVLDEPGQKRSALENLQRLIATGLDEWRGDRLALLLLTRHAEVSERLGDAPAALKAMARILIEYPLEPQAELARGRSVRILARRIDELDGDAAQLADAVRLLRELEPSMADLDGWHRSRNMLASKIADAGLTMMARSEYEAILALDDAENPEISRPDRSATLEGLIGLLGPADRPVLAALLDDFGPEIRDRPQILSAALRVAGPAELEKIAREGGETPYFTGDDYLHIGRIHFEVGNLHAALAAWDRHLSTGKTLPMAMRSRYHHAKSVVHEGLGSDTQDMPGGERDYLDALLDASLREAPDLTRFNGEVSEKMLETAAALAERVRAETASADDANKETE